jgi:quercetin dioxygenase-like cupin family protein
MDPAMRIFKAAASPLAPADSRTFSGRAATCRLARTEEGIPVGLYRVEFADRGRTNWHTHSGPQWLFVLDGLIRVQAWGEPPADVGPGDAIMVPPGQKHWHGAAPGGQGIHLAVNVNAKTEWMEPVTDEQYQTS